MTSRQFYLVNENLNPGEHFWHLGAFEGFNNWELLYQEPRSSQLLELPLKLPIKNRGDEVDFTLAGYAGVPIVSERLAKYLTAYTGIEVLPVIIEPLPAARYFVLRVLHSVDCLDRDQSDFLEFEKNDPIRPDLAGKLKSVKKLRVVGTKVGDTEIFRLANGLNYLIVSARISKDFESMGITGCLLSKVSD